MSDKPKYVIQGVENHSAILLNGLRLTNEDVQALLIRGAEAERIVKEMWEAFYGQNLEFANWHRNGDLEPIDKFFEENDWALDED
jgi:hypothetical protein